MKVEWVLAITISMILMFICYTDVRWRRITNRTTSTIFFLSLLFAFFRLGDISLMSLLMVFFIGFILSIVGVVGAGDVKLVCALSIGLSTTEIGDFLLLIGILGIPLSLLTMLYYRFLSVGNGITVPYGVAICCGYWVLWIV